MDEVYIRVPLSTIEGWSDSMEQIIDPQVKFRENHLEEAKDAIKWSADLARTVLREIEELTE